MSLLALDSPGCKNGRMIKTQSVRRTWTSRKVHQPRLAELIADELRGSILRGELHDGELLPSQDKLCEHFDVGLVSVREALRILESEGLATVRRGNVGGAEVHLPTAHSASRMMAMLMEVRGVKASQLASALQELEPICVTMCAARADRMETVVPELQAVLADSELALADPVAFTLQSRRFHEAMVAGCGNDALLIVVGALESIWSPSARGWAARAEKTDSYPTLTSRRAALRSHSRITSLIVDGNGLAAARLAHEHLQIAQRYSLGSAPDRTVTVEEFG
jgi:GntR family transcriptional regulator, transcriptional repressor for pyruvate dehydrogenase complex